MKTCFWRKTQIFKYKKNLKKNNSMKMLVRKIFVFNDIFNKSFILKYLLLQSKNLTGGQSVSVTGNNRVWMEQR